MSHSDNPEDNKMGLVEHLLELRRRLLFSAIAFLIAFFGCYAFSREIYGFLVQPLADAMRDVGGTQRMIYTAPTEGFFTYLKVSAFAALAVTFPVIAGQIWMFIAPGLYRHEKRALAPFILATPVLFTLGAGMVYYVIMPMAWRYLLSFQASAGEATMPIEMEAKVSEYLDIVMTLMFAFGMCFELPVALTLMAKVGLVSSKGLAEKRRFAVVAVFVIAAVLTPPDVISQIGLAIPLLGLYELSIVACRYIERQRARAEAAADFPGSPDEEE